MSLCKTQCIITTIICHTEAMAWLFFDVADGATATTGLKNNSSNLSVLPINFVHWVPTCALLNFTLSFRCQSKWIYIKKKQNWLLQQVCNFFHKHCQLDHDDIFLSYYKACFCKTHWPHCLRCWWLFSP